MKSFTKHYFISAPIEKVWKALTDSTVIEKWIGEKVKFGDQHGDEFFLWNNSIWGKNLEVVPNKSLTQEWYAGKWEVPSLVTFTLVQADEQRVEIILKHENLPDTETDSVSGGWDEFYMNPLKAWCEKLV